MRDGGRVGERDGGGEGERKKGQQRLKVLMCLCKSNKGAWAAHQFCCSAEHKEWPVALPGPPTTRRSRWP